MARRKTWKAGVKFRVKTAQNNYIAGELYTVNQVSGDNLCGIDEDGTNMGNWIHKNYVVRYENGKDDLLAEKTELESRLADVQAKLDFLASNNLTEFDDNEFKVYQALTVLDETTSKLERAKKLAALMKDLS
jgi:hypothetical protein